MSTIGYENWSVDLANVGPIYPFQGWEVAMTVIGVIFWLGWHRIQFRRELREFELISSKFDQAKAEAAVNQY